MRDDGSLQPVDLTHQADFDLGGMRVRPSIRQVEFSGTIQTLEPRIMQVLVALWRAGGEVVSRDSLIATCWDGRVVGDDAINRSIVELRKLSVASGAFSIENIPRVGYRLVERLNAAARRRRRWPALAMAAVGLAAVVTIAGAGYWVWQAKASPPAPRVAVLPFEAAGNEPALEALARRVTDQTLTAMADETPPLISAPGIRGAAVSITGRVSGSGDKYTTTVQINDARSKATLWSGEVTGPAASLADQASAHASARLSCALTPYRRRLRLDQESLSLWMELCNTSINPAEAEKQHAAGVRLMALAPRFPEAFAMTGVVDARWAQWFPPDEGRAILAAGRSYSRRALELDPKLPVAYLAMGMTAPWSAWAEQEDWLRKGLAAAPDFYMLHARLSLVLASVGRTQDAYRHSTRAMQLAPVSPRVWGMAIVRASGRAAEARISEARARRLWPDNPRIKGELLSAAFEDDPAEALRILDDAARRPRMGDDDIYVWRRFAEVLGGADEKRGETVRALTAALDGRRYRSPEESSSYVRALLWLGERDLAIRALYQLADSPSGPSPSVLFSRDAAALRQDARFMPLAARLGLVDYWRKSGHWPDFCTGPQPELDCRAAAAKAGV